ncbi:MAG: hypothetical protein AAB964_02115 [Patescibacteria group bacterium]
MKKTVVTSALLFSLPLFAFAQQLQPIKGLIRSIGDIIAMLVPILITLALVVFFWGLVKYLWGGAKDHAGGAKMMAMSLLALFVMVSVWGLTALISDALDVDQGVVPEIPRGFVPANR